MPEQAAAPWPSIDDLVEAYESAQVRDGCALIQDYAPPADHPQAIAALCELVRVDLEYGWRRGNPRGIEHYRNLFPDLFRDPGAAHEILFEENRLRIQGGERTTGDGIPLPPTGDRGDRAEGSDDSGGVSGDFPPRRASREHEEYFASLHRSDPRSAARLSRAIRELPQPGSRFLGFQIGGELGRGVFGRVYLARQEDLANRPVALKISADAGVESQALAQLRHTNIVPIHSVHRRGDLHALCMPFLGSTTFANLLAQVRMQSSPPDSGAEFLSSWKPRDDGGPTAGGDTAAVAATGPTTAQVERLGNLDYGRAIVWLLSRLADGLAHAHERGILHRDLKPANILFGDDGEPLLLDFNLASDTKLRGSASAALVGGTVPYMAPEHLASLQGIGPPPDARGDLYSLGVIAFELLTGRAPFPVHRGPVDEIIPRMIADRQGPPPRLRDLNPNISPAVESIVRRLLEPGPGRRYPSARALREDLTRQLDDLPLKHTPEPSLLERVGKWRRRHPRLSSATSVGLVAACLIAGLSGGFAIRHRHLRELEAVDSARRLADEARQVDSLLGPRDADPRQIRDGIELCRRTLSRYGVLADPSWTRSALVATLAPEDRARVRENVGDVLFQWSRAVARQAEAASAADRTRLSAFGLRLSELAEKSYGGQSPPRALWLRRAELQRLAGREDLAGRLVEEARSIPIRSPRDRLLLVADQLDGKSRREILPFLRETSRFDPQNYANWLLLANVYGTIGLDAEAAECYDIGIALRPDLDWAYFNRGLLFLDRKKYERAVADFGRVMELRPSLPVARVNRALARLGLDDVKGAIDDLNSAIASGDVPTRVYFIRAGAYERLGDRDAALRDRREGLRRTPDDEMSWIARGLARLPDDPRGAIADFDSAIRLNAGSLAALQDKASVQSEYLGRPEEAIRTLDVALAHHPDAVPALAGRGVLLARLGRREKALGDAKRAMELDDDAAVLYQIAGVYSQTSRLTPSDAKEAVRLAAAALRKDSSWLRVIPRDTDLDPVRDLPEFRAVCDAVSVVAEAENRARPPAEESR